MLSKPATELTADRLGKLFFDTYNKSYGGNLTIDSQESFDQWCAKANVAVKNSYAFYAEEHPNHPIGIALISEHQSKPGYSQLIALGVVPCFRQIRNGSNMLDIILTKEKARGVSVVEADVLQGDIGSIKLFENAGFSRVGEKLASSRIIPSVKDFSAEVQLFQMKKDIA